MSREEADMEAFNKACEDIRTAIQGVEGWNACLALIICLAECIVYGNSEDDLPDEAMRLAQSMQALGNIVGDMMGGEEGSDDDEDPRPPSPDLLCSLLEKRRAGRAGGKP